jgi:hypothetical protein
LPDYFLPETEMERSFVQAVTLDINRARKRAAQSLAHGYTATGVGQLLSLVQGYAVSRQFLQLQATTDSILEIARGFDTKCRWSLCRICTLIVLVLFDEGCNGSDACVVIVVQLMLKIIRAEERKNSEVIDMFLCLQTVCERKVMSDELEALERSCQSAANDSVTKLDWIYQAIANDSVQTPVASSVGQDKLQLPAMRVPHSKIVAAKGELKRQLLHLQLSEVGETYGMRSAEVTVALVEILEYYAETDEVPSLTSLLDELAGLCKDDAIELTTYQLRSVFSLSAQLHDRDRLLHILEELERALFHRREVAVGYDHITCAALNRLVELWQATGKLVDGKIFCQELVDRAAARLDPDDLTLRRMRSALTKVQRLIEQSSDYQIIVRTAPATALGNNEPHEFASQLAFMALDSYHSGNMSVAENILNELLIFYLDCVGEAERLVGEMAWLLMETDLRRFSVVVGNLIEASLRKASNRLLAKRLAANFTHLLALMNGDRASLEILQRTMSTFKFNQRDPNGKDHQLHGLLLSLLDSRLARVQAMKTPRPFRNENAAHSAFCKYISCKINMQRLCRALVNNSPPDQAKICRGLMWLCEQLALYGDPHAAIHLFESVASVPGSLTNMRAFRITRLLKALSNSIDRADDIMQILDASQNMRLIIGALIEYQDYLSNAKVHDRAIALLRKGLEINSLKAEFKNQLRIRLATQLLIAGNAFEAGVILSEAFSNIPEPHTTTSQQNENGTTTSVIQSQD